MTNNEYWSDEEDKFGHRWPELSVAERCPDCGQPDNCGDCTCHPLTMLQAIDLGAKTPKNPSTEDYVGNEQDGVIVKAYDPGESYWSVLVLVDCDTGGFCDTLEEFDATTHDTVDEAVEAGLEMGREWCHENDIVIGRAGEILAILEDNESLCMDSLEDRMRLAYALDDQLTKSPEL